MLRGEDWWKMTDVSGPLMAAESTSETSVNFYQTTPRNIPEDSHLYTHTVKVKVNNLIYFIFP
jgi:hypothetical protein